MIRIIAGVLMAFSSIAAIAEPRSPYVDEQGTIHLPTDYRRQWAHLGSWVVPQDGAPGQGFHDVYTQPDSVTAFRATGAFPDGTMLIKEIRAVEQGTKTTGEAMWAGSTKVWFVMVKDTTGRFTDHPNWSEGWGWALFKADDPSKNVSVSFAQDCKGCHVPAQKTDWVFVEGYPTLQH